MHARGVRYRVDVRPCPATRARGDLVWKGRRLVVFLDGYFWHACPACGHVPRANRDWWVAKLDANVALHKVGCSWGPKCAGPPVRDRRRLDAMMSTWSMCPGCPVRRWMG
ncbi:hypothetical protein GCU56_03490 [Geodermatophilus sabuli]|uniref:DNA mismatch endonuclease Vsr n=1 Tax=Geodermatophilus sabuli TaxID=1564158 RepID=A0A7K3VYF7_9ACTN|nr:hypothetical protein [Geodermatophilus sabuli]